MSNYFPLCIQMENRPILIFGGANKAREKIEKLLPCGPILTVAAEKVTPTVKKFKMDGKISLIRSNGSDAQALISRLRPMLVIVADVEDDKVAHIFKICRKNGVEVHTVGKTEYSTVLFPAVIQHRNFSIAISSSGASPAAIAWIRDRVEHAFPAAIDGMLENLDTLRKKMAEKIDFKPGQFAAIYADIFNAALRENRMLSAGEMSQIMGKYIDEAK